MERFSAAKLLGSGSSGCVLAVNDGGRTKAMKVRNADLARGTNVDSDAMANEGTVISKLQHVNIVRSLGELRAPLTDAMLSLLPSPEDKVHARIHNTHALIPRTYTHAIRVGLLLGTFLGDELTGVVQGPDVGVP